MEELKIIIATLKYQIVFKTELQSVIYTFISCITLMYKCMIKDACTVKQTVITFISC